MTLPLLRPGWKMPTGAGAAMSLREGGVSAAPWAGLNLGAAVGDDPRAVAENRARFACALAARPVWLRQVHGAAVLELTATLPDPLSMPADAAWTREAGIACTVQVADCLPVLLALHDGSAVAAAHAGWRGLAGGVVEAAVRGLCDGCGAAPGDVQAWLGPCIGPRQFEVGAEVLQAFGVDPRPGGAPRFAWRPRGDGTARWRADLQGLAADRLTALGVRDVTAEPACTVEDASRFFSFRRDGITGRAAAAIWRFG